MKTWIIVSAKDTTAQIVPRHFRSERAAQNVVRNYMERGILPIAVKVISVIR